MYKNIINLQLDEQGHKDWFVFLCKYVAAITLLSKYTAQVFKVRYIEDSLRMFSVYIFLRVSDS